MSIMSNMQIKLRDGVRAEAIQAFIKREIFSECAEAIPGFLWAQLLEVEGTPDQISVICAWTDQTAFEDWVAHPVRSRQEADLAHFLAEPPQTQLYTAKAEYERNS